MENLLGLGNSNSISSSRSCSPGRIMNPHSQTPSSNTKLTDTPSGGGVLHSKHRRKSPEAAQISHDESMSTAIWHIDDSDDIDLLHSSSHFSNGSSEQVGGDEPDSQLAGEQARQQALIKAIQAKIERTKGLIKREQNTRDDNVNEYLKLASGADKQQVQRIKSVFEKKNQKSAQIISQHQKKLEGYTKKIRDVENMRLNSSHRQPREVLRDMGQGLKNVGGNIRDGISGFSGGVVENIKGGLHGAAETVMSKPREFAHLLKNKFGSADNISSLSRNGDGTEDEASRTHHGSATLPGNCTISSGHGSSSAAPKFLSDEGSACSAASESSESNPLGNQTSPLLADAPEHLKPIYAEVRNLQDEVERLKLTIETLKKGQSHEIQCLGAVINDERFRIDRLDEQVNDLTELHQNEVENLKQTLTDMEEKVQYQSEERLRDIHEVLEACQTKISKMEHQQLQHQQYLNLEGIDNSNARALAVKLINILLTVLQVVLLLVATCAGILMPFLKTRLRILTTLVLIGALVFALKQWPELRDVGVHLIRHIKTALSVKRILFALKQWPELRDVGVHLIRHIKTALSVK